MSNEIDILLAVYNPKIEWFEQLLDSLENQTFKNCRLLVRDDCSTSISLEQITDIISTHIKSIPFCIQKNDKNRGSNSTFESLTKEATAPYLAYCDQDDIWEPNKLEILVKTIKETGATLVCSDVSIIDAEGNRKADSISDVRKRHNFYSGNNLASYVMHRNFVIGCTMLVKSEIAKKAVSFCPFYVHDQYIAICAASEGKIVSITDKKLVKYRIHGDNQTGVLTGVTDKESYCKERIEIILQRCEWLRANSPYASALTKEIDELEEWAKNRHACWNGQKYSARIMLKRDKQLAIFEILCSILPKSLFNKLIKRLVK